MAPRRTMRLGIWGALVAEVVLLTFLTSSFGGGNGFESTFLSWSNISQVIRALSFIAIMAVGESLVLITGGVDLSVGSILGLAGVVSAVLLNADVGLAPAVLAGLLVGLACGFLN